MKKNILGWVAVGLSLVISCLWAFWGILENFHEGWHAASLKDNLLGLLLYLAPMLISVGISLWAIRSPLAGGILYVGIGIIFTFFIFAVWNPLKAGLGAALSWFPVTALLVIVGLLYFFGRPRPKKLAYALAAGLPLLVLIGFGLEPAIRVAGRVDDGYRGARLIEGNEVCLIWAPGGPGWPSKSSGWQEAKKTCRYLTEDGKSLASTPQDIWRLPTVQEAVRSMARHGRNCGGVWDPETAHPEYKIKPDKESPLWDTHSQIIYWWTSTETDENKVYSIVYDGSVWAIDKEWQIGSRAFRAVKEPEINAPSEASPDHRVSRRADRRQSLPAPRPRPGPGC
jgi:hypothetical protein